MHVLKSPSPCRGHNISNQIKYIKWFPRDYRAVVHEENWANHPFKRKLYNEFNAISYLREFMFFILGLTWSFFALYI